MPELDPSPGKPLMKRFIPMLPGIYLTAFDCPDLFSALDPDTLADSASVWQTDVSRYSPWVREELAVPGGDRLPFWRAEGYRGGATVFITGACPSTMNVARDLVALKLMSPWDSVLAVEQSAGRGRKERTWISPAGNVYGSWYWPRPGESGSALASLLAATAVASGLERKGIPIRIKWPNDLIVNDRKVCGILVEDRGGDIVVGIGINIVSAPPDAQLRDDFVIPAARLDSVKPGITPLALWVDLVESGRTLVEELSGSLSPAEFVRVFEGRMAWIGRKVLIRRGSEAPFPATIIGTSEDGGLKIRREGRIEVLYTASMIPTE